MRLTTHPKSHILKIQSIFKSRTVLFQDARPILSLSQSFLMVLMKEANKIPGLLFLLVRSWHREERDQWCTGYIHALLTEELNSCLKPWVKWPKVKDVSCTTLFLTNNSIGTRRKVKKNFNENRIQGKKNMHFRKRQRKSTGKITENQ